MRRRLLRVLSGAAVAGALHAVVNVALLRRPPPGPPPVRRPVTVVLPVRDGRRRAARVAAAAAVFAGWDVVLDPQLVQAGYWTWAYPTPGLPGIDTVPLTNLGGWLIAGLVLMSLLELAVERTAVPGRRADAAPLVVIAWMVAGGALAHALWLDLPGSAAWGAVLSLVVLAVLALQARRR